MGNTTGVEAEPDIPKFPPWPGTLPKWTIESTLSLPALMVLAADSTAGVVHAFPVTPPVVLLPAENFSPIATLASNSNPMALAGDGNGTVFIYCGNQNLYSVDYPKPLQTIGPLQAQSQFNANGIAYCQGGIFALGNDGGIFLITPGGSEALIAAVPALNNNTQGLAVDAINQFVYVLSGTTLYVLTLTGNSITTISLPAVLNLPITSFFAAIAVEKNTGTLAVLYWQDEHTPQNANVAELPDLGAQISANQTIHGSSALCPQNFWSSGAIAAAASSGNITFFASALVLGLPGTDSYCQILAIDPATKISATFVSTAAKIQNIASLAVCMTAATMNWMVFDPGRLPGGQPY